MYSVENIAIRKLQKVLTNTCFSIIDYSVHAIEYNYIHVSHCRKLINSLS